MENIAIIGTSGAIGNALLFQIRRCYPHSQIFTFSRSMPKSSLGDSWHHVDITDETSIQIASEKVYVSLDLVIVATGFLHNEVIQPEKSLRELSVEKFEHAFKINTLGPALLAKHFLPKLKRKKRAVFAAISARVSSIQDNRLGGWYSYRASKTALNMILKTASIEASRRNSEAIVVGLHPGTVDSALSQPFQANVPAGKLFSPDYAANKLLDVIDRLAPSNSGQVLDFSGIPVPA